MKYLRGSKAAALLGLPLFLLAAVVFPITSASAASSLRGNAAEHPAVSSAVTVGKRFFAWSTQALQTDEHGSDSTYPLWSTREHKSAEDVDVVFSFSLSGSALKKQEDRRRRLAGDDHADDGHADDAHGDGHDTHSDAHEMVVHVTYEDICEYELGGYHVPRFV